MKFQVDTKWLEPVTRPIPAELLLQFGNTPLLAQGLLRHNIRTPGEAQAFLDPRQYQPSNPFDLPDMDKAVARLLHAIQKHETIGVWGDFDVDGQTSTTLLVSALRQLGADVRYHIPIRAKEGHGVHLRTLERFLQEGVQVLLTCDTGIDAREAVEFCRGHGVDFVITDHHTLPETLPPATAVVNPQRLPEAHPARTLSGVGAAWKLISALGIEIGNPEIAAQSLDLAALGLVADVALLTGDARYLVQLGLEQLRHPHRPGLQKLYELAEINPAHLTETHIGFNIAPRLNAIGRLDDANPVVDFLTTNDPQIISVLAARLEGLNGERRFLTEQVFAGALAQIERTPALLDEPALLLSHSDWPAGVVGIVASRLVDLFQRPVALLSSPPGEPARGSARSIEGVNVTEAIAAGKDYLFSYGGHAMAAGLAIEIQNLTAFQRQFNDSIRSQMGDKPRIKQIQIDSFLELNQIQQKLIEEVNPLAPFGAGNPAFVFATKNLHAVESNPIGKTGEHLQVLVENERGETRRLLWWQGVQSLLPAGIFDLAYTLRSSNYRGQPEIQMEWLNARLAPETAVEITAPRYEQIVDQRSTSTPLDLLPMYTREDYLLWQEGADRLPGSTDRLHMHQADTLIIWNPPPGRNELERVLRIVTPKKIILFSVSGRDVSAVDFLKNLTGMVRFALRMKGGRISLETIATKLNQRVSAVEAGLRWLSARGFIRIIQESYQEFELAEGGVPDEEKVKIMENALRGILQETAAFRSFYTHADPRLLLQPG